MISLATFFELNEEIILFVYGLVFFMMGFTVVLQTYQSARLELARSLRWLATFGLLHGFAEWGNFFIPIQAQYMSASTIQALQVFQLILLAISFACLFEFANATLRPLGQARWLRGVAAALLITWTLSLFLIIIPSQPEAKVWVNTANALARYCIGFPGAILAAYGLREHTRRRIKPLNVPSIVTALRFVVAGLVGFAVLGGLVPPPVGFFPGTWLNTQSFMALVGIPVTIFRAASGLVIVIAIIRALEIFGHETQRQIELLEQERIIEADHQRLARELHDGAIQKVYTAGLLVESAARLVKPNTEVGLRLERAMAVLKDSVVDLRRNLADLHVNHTPPSESFKELLARLVADPHYNSLVDISLDIQLPTHNQLSPVRTDHVFAILNEAMSNVARHAHAQNVEIQAQDLGELLQITIKDDGIGIRPNAQPGYGLRNMRDRARLLNGKLNFSHPKNKGTIVTLEIPWVD